MEFYVFFLPFLITDFLLILITNLYTYSFILMNTNMSFIILFMKWLLITDTKDLQDKLKERLMAINKKNKLVTINFKLEDLKKEIKSISTFAGCVIFSKDQNALTNNIMLSLSNFTEILMYESVTTLTNLTVLKDATLGSIKQLLITLNEEDVLNTINKKYNRLVENSVKRIAKHSLLDQGIPFTPDCFGTYIAKNKEEIIDKFLEAGMGVNVRDDTGTPMLNIACRNDNYEIVEKFIGLGAEINATSEDRGYTAVMDAIWKGNEKITAYLISKGADLNTINKEGQNNLILAVGADRVNLIKMLVENGADPDVKDMMGMSAYNYSTLFRKEKITQILKPYHKES